MREVTTWEWDLGGGWSDGLAPGLAWTLLVTSLLAAAALVWWSYRRPLQCLTPLRSNVLWALRFGFAAALAICLANPTVVKRTTLEPKVSRPVAVLIDRSDSMTEPDHRGNRRLDEALRIWRSVEPSTHDTAPARYFAFADEMVPASNADQASRAETPGGETRLFSSLGRLLADAPPEGYEALYVLTDGLDTTEETSDAVMSQALGSGTPIFVVPGRNRTMPEAFAAIKDVRTPARVLRQTLFEVAGTIDAYMEESGEQEIMVWQGDRKLASSVVRLGEGRNLVPWSAEVRAGEPGLMEMEVKLSGAERSRRVDVEVTERLPVRLLYYQGALDWGYRFLANTLRRDPSFEIETIFNPAIRMETPHAKFKDLPERAVDLAGYNLVVLACPLASQLSERQQTALRDYAREGGGILFLAPDTLGTKTFAGTKLEELLPVKFERPGPQSDEITREEAFRNMMASGRRKVDNLLETEFAREADARTDRSPLQAFAFPDETSVAPFFFVSGKALVPQFSSFAQVAQIKPGASVLAQHPALRHPESDSPYVLLAAQPFGRGLAAVLASDSLWRWKMALPSEAKDVEIFWQQFLGWLAQPVKGIRFRSVDAPFVVGRPAAIEIEEPGTGPPPEVFAFGGSSSEPVQLRVTPLGDRGSWRTDWVPSAPGEWKLVARGQGAMEARAHLTVTEHGQRKEASGLPPDIEGLRRLARATGGQVLDNTSPRLVGPQPMSAGEEMIGQERRHLWNSPWLIAFCLACYSTELILRRRWKMV
jgi:hypothetical protein